MKSFAMVGAGNVAWHMSQALVKAGFAPLCVYSRSAEKARELAGVLGTTAVSTFGSITNKADVYIIAVKDDSIPEVISAVAQLNKKSLYLHTAGSVSIDVFKGKTARYGVLYPLQSFTKGRSLDFSRIPLFIEGDSSETTDDIRLLAQKISVAKVTELNSEKRKLMHLAAVFASNFVNHCYACAADILNSSGVSFQTLLPLIEETCGKVHEMSPARAQTGPALRYDKKVMETHESMLDGTLLDVYRVMSRSIHEKSLVEP